MLLEKFVNKNIISKLRYCSQLLFLLLTVAAILAHNKVAIVAIFSAVLLGPIYCGWMCSFGFYQDTLRYIGRLIKKEPLEIDEKIHKYLRFSRFIILAGALTVGGIFLFPKHVGHSFGGLLSGHVVFNFALYFIIAVGILSLFVKRFYCRYCCTFGAKLGLYSLLRFITINRNKETCVGCKLCSKECPMHINVHEANSLVNLTCISCFRCVEVCPHKCLKVGLRNYLKP